VASVCAIPLWATTTPEVEPNETKPTATPVLAMAPGDTLTGITTGTSTTVPGAASADTFRVKTAAAAAGIYRHTLTLTTVGAAGHAGSILGTTQAGVSEGVWDGFTVGVASTTSTVLQASTTGTNPARSNAWYGFGREEEVYYRVAGTAATTDAYVATLTRSVVVPVAGPTAVPAGPATISTIGQTTVDTDMWLYDSAFNAILGAGNDDESTNSGGTGATNQGRFTRTLAPGTYYLAVARFNLANNMGSPNDDDFRTGAMLDFPDAVLGTSSSTAAADFDVSINGTVVTVLGAASAGYDVQFVQFTVVPGTDPTPPTGFASATPSVLFAGSMGPVNPTAPTTGEVNVNVTPGVNPVSTGMTVSLDASAAGLGTIALHDDGVAPDDVAGDNIFSAAVNATGAANGAFSLPVLVADAQQRSSSTTLALSIRAGLGSLGVIDATSDGLRINDASVGAGEVRWYSFDLPCAVDAQNQAFFDINTSGSTGAPDTEIALYSSLGALLDTDDDDGVLRQSALSFGAGSGLPQGGTGTTDTTPVVSDGRDGETLPAGTYYLALASFNATFNASNFNAVGTGPAAAIDAVFDTNLACTIQCDSVDFNNDQIFPDTADLADFLSVFAGGPCSNDPNCNDVDFNNDGILPDTLDIESLLSVFSGGPCL
jgi:hypothetical protein